MTYPINALYGHGYSYDPVADGYQDASTADVVGKMNALYSGPGGALRSLRNMVPENTEGGLSALNMLRSGLNTSANWLQGNPEIGPDTLAPLGLGSMGTGLANALTRAAPDAGIARSLSQQFPGEPAIGDMIRTRIAGANRIGVSGEDGMTPLARTDGAMRSPGDAVTRAPYGMGRPANDLLADNAKSSVPGTVVNSIDMSEAARMQRAKEMGFDTDRTWYHGTRQEFDEFKLPGGHKTAGNYIDGPGEADVAIFMSNNPTVASAYAGKWDEGSRVIPAHLGLKNPRQIKTSGELYRDENAELIESSMKRGHDGIIYTYPNGNQEAVVFDPRNIRSTQAAFDPARRDSANLLAASPSSSAPGLAANSTQQSPDSGVLDILRKYGLSAE